MISVKEADEIILSQNLDFGNETIDITEAIDRVLAENIIADRDFPPFDRVTMDGIAISFEGFEGEGSQFKIIGLQAAGEVQLSIPYKNDCIEIMTGAMLPHGTDTVIRYEDLVITDGKAKVTSDVKKDQNVHIKGSDVKLADILIRLGKCINSADIGILATVGKKEILVKKKPRILLISSGNELVDINTIPLLHQIRSSNSYAIQSLLKKWGFGSDTLHIADDLTETRKSIANSLEKYDVILLSGGVSMGKKDFIPEALDFNDVEKLFHKVLQRPGKPFWFGRTDKNLVFALPGNPVSSFMCAVRYVLPWLIKNEGNSYKKIRAKLGETIIFKPELSYFLQVVLKNTDGTLRAYPIKHNGSGDFANLSFAHGFAELPATKEDKYPDDMVLDVYTY